jgi:hypothetical protein
MDGICNSEGAAIKTDWSPVTTWLGHKILSLMYLDIKILDEKQSGGKGCDAQYLHQRRLAHVLVSDYCAARGGGHVEF